MKAIFKKEILVLVPETGQERSEAGVWKTGREEHVLLISRSRGPGLALRDLGPKPDVCNEPFQVISTSRDPAARLISNFAPTPFILMGLNYQSVEGFWQGLRFEDKAERRLIAALTGPEAKRAGRLQPYAGTVSFDGKQVPVGTWQHWQLMELACWAKFTQHEAARLALLSTGDRPLQHRVRRDSKTIPGVIMAEIWMRIRKKLGGPGRGRAATK